MEENYQKIEDELSDLRKELKNFEKEKERVRAIIGQIGGVPKFRTKLINATFIAIIIITVIISIIAGEQLRLLMIEVATVTLSAKIIYLMHRQMRINHFEFWVLSSIEWRINEMMTLIKKMKK